jgi:hypothetical protein
MRRIILMLMVVMVVGLSATAASAALSAEAKADLDALTAATGDLDSTTDAEELEAGYFAAKQAAAKLKVSAGDDLNLDALEAALGDLDDLLTGVVSTNKPEDFFAAGDAVVAAIADVVAQAEAADADDGTAAPTAVDTGSAVNGGPSTVLLGVGAVLALLAGGALVLRRTADRR